jgi:hypothetical protein
MLFDNAEFLEELGDLMEELGYAIWVHDTILGNHVEDPLECWCIAERIILVPITVGEA